MSKKILVLTGSPRKNGNSDALADAFIKGAQGSGNKILRFDAGKKSLLGCHACEQCFTGKGACIFDDEFNQFAEYLQMADSLVIITPLYWFSFPSQLKATIDRIYSFYFSGKAIKVKESFLIVCAQGVKESMFNGVIRTYEDITNLLKLTNKGHLVVPGVNKKGEILRTPAIQGAEKIGKYF